MPADREKDWMWQSAVILGREATMAARAAAEAWLKELVRGLTNVRSVSAHASTGAAVLGSGRIMTWGEVRPWTRPDGQRDLSPLPILLWVDGLDQS